MPSPLMKMTFFAVGAFAFAVLCGALADAPGVGLSTMVATTAADAAATGAPHRIPRTFLFTKLSHGHRKVLPLQSNGVMIGRSRTASDVWANTPRP